MPKGNILFFIIFLLINFFATPLLGADEVMLPQRLIDCPTAAVSRENRAYLYFRIFGQGGVLGAANMGLASRFSIGLSMSGINIIGDEEMKSNIVGIQLKYMIWEENERDNGWPAITMGLDTQGYGFYDDIRNRYQFKSKGLYLVLSKNYIIDPGLYLSNLGVHTGINFTFENDDESNGFDIFLGLDKVVIETRERTRPVLEFMLEYDLGLNDDKSDGVFGESANLGYVNIGARWSPHPALFMEYIIKNVNKNNADPTHEIALTLRTDYKLQLQ